jgi:hypothetical protein
MESSLKFPYRRPNLKLEVVEINGVIWRGKWGLGSFDKLRINVS